MQEKLKTVNKNFWEGEKIRLRPCRASDVDAYVKAEEDSEAIRIFEGRIQPQRSEALIKEWLDRESTQQKARCLSFTVESLNNEIVGYANIRNWINQDGIFSFGIRIFKPYQRQGFARDAVIILLRYGFFELRCQKANSATIATNVSSIEFHHTLGFQDEGRIRRNCFTNGQYYDEVLFGLTVEEFMEINQTS